MLNSKNKYGTPGHGTHNLLSYEPSQARNLNDQHSASQKTGLKTMEFSYTRDKVYVPPDEDIC